MACTIYDQHCFICRLLDFTLSENAGIEPRTIITSALAIRGSNHSARSHPLLGWISSRNRLELILSGHTRIQFSARSHPLMGQISSTTRLDLIHYMARSHPCTIGLNFIHHWLDLIHYRARSHPLLDYRKYHPLLGQISSTTALDLIHYQARSHSLLGYVTSTAGLDLIYSTRQDLIHYSAKSHPLLLILSTSELHLIQ